jgi:hypothetical protein
MWERQFMARNEGVSRAGLREIPLCTARLLLFSSVIMKLCIFVGVNAGGYAGWVLGEPYGLMVAFLISSVGSILGVIAGWKVARHYLA